MKVNKSMLYWAILKKLSVVGNISEKKRQQEGREFLFFFKEPFQILRGCGSFVYRHKTYFWFFLQK